MNCPRSPEGAPMSFTPLLSDDHYLTPDAVAIPMRLKKAVNQKLKKDDGNGQFGSLLQEAASTYQTDDEKPTANLSAGARAYLSKIGIKNPDQDEATASLLWMHCLAVGFAQAYLTENSDAISADWPRVPLPASKTSLLASAKMGRRVADLLNTEQPVVGVDAGKVDTDLVTTAVVTCVSQGPLNLSLTAGWGHRGNEGVVMPGKGKMVTAVIDAGPDYKLPWFQFHDIYLNETACWKDIPAPVWQFTIGGYQVIKKWLSYREFELLGRALTPDEAREVTHMARRIAALILLQP
jgi:hypothetical protein